MNNMENCQTFDQNMKSDCIKEATMSSDRLLSFWEKLNQLITKAFLINFNRNELKTNIFSSVFKNLRRSIEFLESFSTWH